MSEFAGQIEKAVEALEIHGPTTYSWFGRRSPDLPPKIRRSLGRNGGGDDYLKSCIQLQLYNDFYVRGRATPGSVHYEPRRRGSPPFVQALSNANLGQGYWSEGWVLQALRQDIARVSKDGLTLQLPRADIAPQASEPDGPGSKVSVRFAKERFGISPGFYLALSNRELPARHGGLVRLYWHLDAAGAVRLVECATTLLNSAGLAFRLKVLNHPDRFDRCDTAVLYLRSVDFAASGEALNEMFVEVRKHLREGVPCMTRQVGHGVSLAEDPGSGESYGMHRCGLLAEALVGARQRGALGVSERMRCVAGTFAEAGLSLDRPYLNGGSTDVHRLELPGDPARAQPAGPRSVQAGSYLEAAGALARAITRNSVWHENRCTWMGAEPDPTAVAGSTSRLVFKTHGPSLYMGTSGVALFLAEIHSVTGERETRRVALGALRQSLARTADVPPAQRIGLFTGWTGVAFAAVRAARLLGDFGLLEEALELAQRARECAAATAEADVIGGRAGAIIALLALDAAVPGRQFGEQAALWGDDLIHAARRSRSGLSWSTPGFAHQRHLTGFAHGASGVGLALAELYRATGLVAYRNPAQQAFRYERQWFDPEQRNWPDFREEPGRRTPRKGPFRFATAWCHGAPGIALARLRAYETLQDPELLNEALTALGTTRKTCETWMHLEGVNYSLCHGLAGNAEILLEGAEALEQGQSENRALAQQVADYGLERFAARQQWPCGTGGEETPNLMLGLAGIGLFYLRMAKPVVPSVLLLRPERHAAHPRRL